ncbi:MAG: bifunctional transaldolase/phosoglucose isomerase [Gemmatales bacterium]|nr:bifunctional transaldolase/phosoglucose isomerase [Gemmatales bacterium]MDW8385842.1 bifunctional transaldolase/phosoglucose isomerase [Gemmatales bacterium]
MTTRIRQLHDEFGQSIWYDNISRSLIASGRLARMVHEDGLKGLTSNPAIFCKAVTSGADYDSQIADLVRAGFDSLAIYETLACKDIQDAADILRPIYDRTEGRDGFVSLEVSPYLAHDTEGTVAEARRLWQMVQRPNLLIKVPATPQGIPAIRQLIGEGISVNVTLLFAVEIYEQVAWSYIAGLEAAQRQGRDLRTIASVASFFVSRIDTLVDERLEKLAQSAKTAEDRERLLDLRGRAAIANAVLAFEKYQAIFASERWQNLVRHGARPQRLLWASTSTKNPRYPRTLYVDHLVAPGTVNTVPEETYQALQDECAPVEPLTKGLNEKADQARRLFGTLSEIGIEMAEVTATLLPDGVRKFCDPFDQLLGAIESKRQTILGTRLNSAVFQPDPRSEPVGQVAEQWRIAGNVRRLWAGDASLWTGHDESRWLGWLSIVEKQRQNASLWRELAEEVTRSGWKQAVVLGMGGSSLCPEVLRQTFGTRPGFPELHVLDSTVPGQILDLESRLDLSHTLFLVSSKSGTTVESNMLMHYFWDRVEQATGGEPGPHFAAVTDPGTDLERLARQRGFRRIFHGEPSIGGRFSALSHFGMVPAAIQGLDVPDLLDRTLHMVRSCAAAVPPAINPGVALGLYLGTWARAGRDKTTFVISASLTSLGLWLEQLLAESTGKNGRGLVPVADERLGPPECYGDDRLFVAIALEGDDFGSQEQHLRALESAGHPIVRIRLADSRNLAQEFFRWEIATAVAGAILGVNPFDQPDVEASKEAARKVLRSYAETGRLPSAEPLWVENGIAFYSDDAGAEAFRPCRSAADLIRSHLQRIGPGDYFAVCAFLEMRPDYDAELQAMRHHVRNVKRVATTLGYGPRFLHSTGQLHKGGPNTGVFLQLSCEDALDVPIPGQQITFGTLKEAQARGDFAVLCQRGRRVLRVRLGTEVVTGLRRLRAWLEQV